MQFQANYVIFRLMPLKSGWYFNHRASHKCSRQHHYSPNHPTHMFDTRENEKYWLHQQNEFKEISRNM